MRKLLILLLALPLFAQAQKDDDVLTQLDAVKHIEEVAISPDAKPVAWRVESEAGVHWSALDGSDAHFLMGGKDATTDVGMAFSPDSKSIAFLFGGQLFIDAIKVTSLDGYVAEPKWSPDGKS